MTAPTSPVLIFGREPAVLAELVAAILIAVNLFLLPDFNTVLQGAINAVVVAAASIYVAFKVRSENLLPLLLGGFKVLVALFVAFGVNWDDGQQAAALGLAAIVAGLFVRTQATAPVASDGTVVATVGRHAAA
jgi:type II secretory pathway component PulF